MKVNFIHSILSCLAAFALPFMVACSRQDDPLPEAGNGIQAVFTLYLGDDAQEKTRTTPTDGLYDKGSGLENAIGFDNNDFCCYLFDTDNKFVSAPKAVSIFEISDKKYQLRFRMEDSDEVKSALTNGCRFVFLANWGSYPEPSPEMTIKQLCADPKAVFEFSQEKRVLSDKKLIPMYGVKEFERGVQDFKDGKTISDIGVLHILRAYAKVEVNVSFEDFKGTTAVKSVSLTRSNDKGYKAPENVTNEKDYVTGSWKTDYTNVNIPTDATVIENLSLTEQPVEDGNKRYVAYVPEYKNVGSESPSRIKVSFTIDGGNESGGQEAEGYVDFQYSKNPPEGAIAGQAFDIARNNWYKFNVVVKGKDITWNVDVHPWDDIEIDEIIMSK